MWSFTFKASRSSRRQLQSPTPGPLYWLLYCLSPKMMHCMAALWTSGELVWIKSSLSWEDGESLGLVSVNWRVCPFHCRMEGKRNRWLEKSCYYLRCHPLLFCFCLFFFFPEYIFWLFLRVLICSSLHWSVSGLSTATCSSFQLPFLIPLPIEQPNRRPLRNAVFQQKTNN